ncbi:DEAD/DEAH box helicase [Piscinibacterium candidicorallinum]|uniref:DEAD/DEAH box helicase n=1 Tax=Piscinibacterium candidicorallinum TaxID=1793872 RepID=A0ABV7H9R6_9BURK
MSFKELGLAEPILRAIAAKGYENPTPIQAQAIPAVLSEGDVLAAAQTGTGKTAGFTLPMLHLLEQRRVARKPASPIDEVVAKGTKGARFPIRALILTPTRELAAQVAESVSTYGANLPLKAAVVFGGVGINPQIDKLRRGVDILIATPGRLLDLVNQRACDLSQVELLVLDEADRMLDMGFIPDVRRILKLLPEKIDGRRRQNLLFSATFSPEIKSLAGTFLHEPQTIEVSRNTTATLVTHTVHPVTKDAKRQMLSHLIKMHSWFQVLVFTRMKHGADRLVKALAEDGIEAMALHGNKSQNQRTRALAAFKSGELQVLVATDIAARGIDIAELPVVINYDLPQVAEDYVHRIGRTGRAGAEGLAVSLVEPEDGAMLREIERLINQPIPRAAVEGFEAPELPANGRPPAREQRGRGQRPQREPREARPARGDVNAPRAPRPPREAKSNEQPARPRNEPRRPRQPDTGAPVADWRDDREQVAAPRPVNTDGEGQREQAPRRERPARNKGQGGQGQQQARGQSQQGQGGQQNQGRGQRTERNERQPGANAWQPKVGDTRKRGKPEEIGTSTATGFVVGTGFGSTRGTDNGGGGRGRGGSWGGGRRDERRESTGNHWADRAGFKRA